VQLYHITDDTERKQQLDLQKENETRLQEAIQAAQAASVAKSVFVANMSQAIKNPINSIIGFSELAMEDDIAPANMKDFLFKIKDNTEWLLRIVNDILDVIKIETGRMELENIPFELKDIFDHCQTKFTQKAVEKGINMRFDLMPLPDRKLIGDPTRLRQIFINIISNAVKSTNVGEIRTVASIKSATDNTCTVHFVVKDSGIGIPSEKLSRLFDPFLPVDPGSMREYGGTGLGLPIAKNIIKLMGGELGVESIVGAGCKFTFDITFKTIEIPSETRDSDDIYIDKPTFNGLVLICEDNRINQKLVCDHLAKVGLETVVADNGKIGVDMVRDRIENGRPPFDLIFMDIHMPVMDGLEAASIIIGTGVKTPIVALTANVMATQPEAYKAKGITDLLGKPYTSQELWRCLLKFIKPVRNSIASANPLDDIDESLHMQLLEDFYTELQTIYTEIKDAFNANDFVLTQRLVNTLKGNAGIFQRNSLHKAIIDIERLITGEACSVTDEHLSALKTEIDMVLKELRPLFERS
jgi:CheY-like chemotaxis protein